MSMESADVRARSPQSVLLTFLIADVRGYTRFTREHGDEAAARLAGRFADLTEEVVTGHQGDVIELRGDEALCVFPSARNALRCSLALQAAFAQAREADPALPLAVGIGLDAGEAVPIKGGYRGGALNLAARLCALAGPDEVLATRTVMALSGMVEGLRYEPREPVSLKGFADPVEIVAIRSTSPTAGQGSRATLPHPEHVDQAVAPDLPGSFPPLASLPDQESPSVVSLPTGGFLGSLPTGQLVGRDAELGRLLEAVEGVEHGEGRLVLLAGEPGIGKTRLAQEVTLALRDRGFILAAGRCYEPEQTVPYYPFLDALAMAYSAAPLSIKHDAGQRWPYLGTLLPDQVGAPNIEGRGPDDQQNVFRAVTGFLEAVSATSPLGILIDDLHWVDSTSVRLLLHLARHTRTKPILLLGTYRDMEIGSEHPLAGALRDLDRDGLMERVVLDRLDEGETAALVASTLEGEKVSHDFASLVHGRTEGNPYFVHQVLRVLVERGDVFQRDGKWDRRAIEEIEVPDSVRSVVKQRLSRLADPTQGVLRQASALGQTFAFDDLLVISEREEREVEDALEEASGAGLVRELGRDTYGFDHALTQQSIYAELSSRRKRRLHLAAGDALEALPERARMGRAAEIAWHFLEADDKVRAIRYTVLAGDQAEAVFAHSEAEYQYRTAAQLAEEIGESGTQAEVLEKLGKVHELESRPDKGLEALEAAARIYHAAGDLMGEARVTAGVGSALMHLGKPEEAIMRLQSMLAALEAEGPSTVLATLALQLSAILYGHGQLDPSMKLAEQARDVARAIGDLKTLSGAELYRGDVLMQMGRMEDARQVFEGILPDAEATGDLGLIAHSANDAAVTYINTGRFAQGVKDAQRAVELQQRRESPSMVAFAHVILGMAYFYWGQWPEARRSLEEGARLIESLPPSWHAPFVYGYLGMVDTVEGRWEEAKEHLERAIVIGGESHFVLPQAHQWLAEQEILEGNPVAARARLEPFVADTSMWSLMMLPTLGWARLESGDIAAADALVTRLVTDTTVQVPIMVAEALQVQGMVRHRQGQDEEAQRIFEQALALTRRMEYRHMEARALLAQGQMCAETGDPEGAREQWEAALRIFQELGARPDVKRTERALAHLASDARA